MTMERQLAAAACLPRRLAVADASQHDHARLTGLNAVARCYRSRADVGFPTAACARAPEVDLPQERPPWRVG